MSNISPEKLEMHDSFWKRIPMKRPLMTFHTSDRFPYDKMRASRALMKHGLVITPDMIDVDAFVDQTEEQISFRVGNNIHSDSIRGVSPFGGIPWMECLLGCGVVAMEHSFISVPCYKSPGDPDNLPVSTQWLEKYKEFLEKYSTRFGDRYPLTETLMRGCLDTYGALIGQEDMIYALYDEPDIAAAMLDRINQVYVDMVNLTLTYSRKIAGGMLHPYGIWTPGTVNQFQEDLCALVTPQQMRDFVIPLHNRMCSQFDYNGIHTHPTSYHVMDEQISVGKLQLVQVQKDEGDPPVFNRLEVFEKIQKSGKCLYIGGDFSLDEIDALITTLDISGLAFSIMLDKEASAQQYFDFICEKCQNKS